MAEKMKINGIRLNNNLIQVTQNNIDMLRHTKKLLYQTFESNLINMELMSLNTVTSNSFVSTTIASKHFAKITRQDGDWFYHQDVSSISIFPHNCKLNLLAYTLSLIGKYKLQFLYMISSNSMLTFIVNQQNCNNFVKILSSNFDLPESHVPFIQEESKELAQLLKRQYPETSATYVENKIKTYGIALTKDLHLASYSFPVDQLTVFGDKLKAMLGEEDKFVNVSAHINREKQVNLFAVAQKQLPVTPDQTCFAELLSFQGPHFGDRHSIISRALRCLTKNKIPVLLAGCTGASIGIVLPDGKGKDAEHVLMNVFEVP